MPPQNGWKHETIDNETRISIEISPDTPTCFEGRVPTAGARLQFAWAAARGGAGTFTLVLQAESTLRTLLTEPLPEDVSRWHERVVDLADGAGKKVMLTARVSGGTGRVQLATPMLAPSAAARNHRNVILISLDTLRADHLGCYGYPRPTSPQIDRFAERALLFENCISAAPWTLPAHASLFTGQYSSTHGLLDDGLGSIPSMRTPELPADTATLPELLAAGGYETRAISSHVYVSESFGFQRGFNVYQYKFDQPAQAVTDRATAWLHQIAGAPFFLFLHYFDIHDPYDPPPPFDRMFDPGYRGTVANARPGRHAQLSPADLNHLIALYDGEIRSVDQQLGRLFDYLAAQGLLENTLVIITADHGEEFNDHGSYGHSLTLYEEVIRVPLIVHLPGGTDGAPRIGPPVSLIDIMPTVLDFAKIPRPKDRRGISLLQGPSGRAGAAVYAETSRYRACQACARTAAEKYIISDGMQGQTEELYLLRDDPREYRNLAALQPEISRKLRSSLLGTCDLSLVTQLCLRVAGPPGPYRVQGRISTSGRFVYADTIGWWNQGSIGFDAAHRVLTIDHTNSFDLRGINFSIAPPDAALTIDGFMLNNQPAAVSLCMPSGADLKPSVRGSMQQFAGSLAHTPVPLSAGRPAVVLFASPALLPNREAATGAGATWQRKQLRDDDLERLKVLGYIQ